MSELVMKYQQYAEYKDSGVEWLGEIPKNWEVVRLKYIAELSGNKISGSENQYVGLENVESKTGKFKVTEGIVSEGVSNTFEKDNLLFGKLRPYLAKSWLASFSGICSSEFLVLNSQLVHPKFLKYMTLTDEFVEQVNSSTYGSKMPRASWDFIGLLQLPVMDYGVSETIANFLDHETAQIDILIEKQQTLIQLLKEKRQAVISHAVTKGLNPDAPMKDSGVEWLGEVPEGWTIPQIGYHSKVTKLTGFEYTNLWRPNMEGSIIALRGFNIQERYLDLSKTEKITEELSNKLERSKLHEGDIVLPCTGTLGNAALIQESNLYHINQNIAKVSINKKLFKPEFAVFWMTSLPFRQMIDFNNTSGMQPVLLIGDIRKLPIPLAPLSEQQEIIDFLLIKVEQFDRLIDNAEQAIQLMQERRTALISAAVTGKIDVRGWVAPESR